MALTQPTTLPSNILTKSLFSAGMRKKNKETIKNMTKTKAEILMIILMFGMVILQYFYFIF